MIPIESPVQANVWKVIAEEGQTLKQNDKVTILEAMKMEIDVVVPETLVGGSLHRVLIKPGDTVQSGQTLAIVKVAE